MYLESINRRRTQTAASGKDEIDRRTISSRRVSGRGGGSVAGMRKGVGVEVALGKELIHQTLQVRSSRGKVDSLVIGMKEARKFYIAEENLEIALSSQLSTH